MSKRVIYGKVIDCELNESAALDFLASLAFHNEKEVRVTIERKRKPTSNPLHAYYRSVVLPLCVYHYQDRGYNVTEAQVHTELKAIFGPDENIGIQEPLYRKKESMADYTQDETLKFLEDIKRAFAEEGTVIPDPNEHLNPPIQVYL